MKLREFLVLLLFLNQLLSCWSYEDCEQSSDSDTGELIATIALGVADALLSEVPGGGVVSAIGNTLFSVFTMEEQINYGQIVGCYLRNYHIGILYSNARQHDKEIADASKDQTQLEEIRNNFESANNMDKLVTQDPNVKAAAFPLLGYWAGVHLSLYKHLINLNESPKYKLKSDEWTLFYAKMILQYWRPYRNTKHDRSRDVIQNPAENLLKDWPNMLYSQGAKKTLSNMLDSCKVKNKNAVMFQTSWIFEPGKHWLSCWNSGSKCELDACPDKNGPFHAGNYQYGVECRGELFWIYSNDELIENGRMVNVMYSIKNGNGYWVSLPSTKYIKTQTCPGLPGNFKINPKCHQENFIVDKLLPHSDYKHVVYDGNIITLRIDGLSHHYLFNMEVYSYGAETLNADFIEKPSSGYTYQECDANHIGLCILGLESHEGSLYYFHKKDGKKYTWYEAENSCKSWFDAHLASFHSKHEFDYIVDNVQRVNSPARFVDWSELTWTGAIKNGGVWQWIDGTPMNSAVLNQLWYPGNPSGDGPRIEIVGRQLNDLGGFASRDSFVCKKSVLPKQCTPNNYNILSEHSRSITQPGARYCDGYENDRVTSPSWVGSGWYKFSAGKKMATSPPTIRRCGTDATGFMVDNPPTLIGDTKDVKFCFNWDGNDCRWSTLGEVTKCGEGDFVYKLQNVPWCALRYCAVP